MTNSANKFQCYNCLHTFKIKHNLVIHIETNHDDYPGAACIVCENLCTTRDGLRKHMARYPSTGCMRVQRWGRLVHPGISVLFFCGFLSVCTFKRKVKFGLGEIWWDLDGLVQIIFLTNLLLAATAAQEAHLSVRVSVCPCVCSHFVFLQLLVTFGNCW